jgi:TonB family protein
LRTSKRNGLTLVVSAALHVVAAAGLVIGRAGAQTAPEPLATATPARPAPVPAGLPVVEEGISIVDEPVEPALPPPAAGAGDTVARPDTGRPGRGGEATAREPAVNLADVDEQLRYSPELLSRLDRDQVQRLRVRRERRSFEDRRSTPHPAELTFVAIGNGAVFERRPHAMRDPSRGALESPEASAAGAAVGSGADAPADEDARLASNRLGGAIPGSYEAMPGVGLRDAPAGRDHRVAAYVANARPAVTSGPVAVPTLGHGRPEDDVDSRQEVATTVRALVHASTAGGAPGDGEGGSRGGGDPGAEGAQDARSAARPLGLGEGEIYDYWTRDPRLLPYFRRLHARLDPLWASAFPKTALLDLKQGTVILEFTVFADGHVAVAWPPLRPSGVDEFDRNVADAIRRAAPFEPLPRELNTSRLVIRAPFVANNPIVK